jgi:hypothetical protein
LAQVFQRINESRKEKTRFLHADRAGFLKQLKEELTTEQRLSDREATTLAVRLNTFSDIVFESKAFGEIPQQFPDAVFYDYTKLRQRVWKAPENYTICASWTEDEEDQGECIELLNRGHNVAVVFAELGNFTGNRALSQRLPKRWSLGGHTYEVFDGDDSDLRFLDPGPTRAGFGRICGLRLKSGNSQMRLQAMASGFCQIFEWFDGTTETPSTMCSAFFMRGGVFQLARCLAETIKDKKIRLYSLCQSTFRLSGCSRPSGSPDAADLPALRMQPTFRLSRKPHRIRIQAEIVGAGSGALGTCLV